MTRTILAYALTGAIALTTGTAAADDAGSQHHGSAYIDPAGFLLFGPTLGVEAGADHFTGAVYGRWFSGGLLSRQFFLNHDRQPPDTFDFSYGIGLRGRFYPFGAMAGLHVGVQLEYLHSRVLDNVDLLATDSAYLVPAIEGGYRYPFLHRFYVGGAVALGYAVQLSASNENLPGGGQAAFSTTTNESRFYGSVAVEIGVYF